MTGMVISYYYLFNVGGEHHVFLKDSGFVQMIVWGDVDFLLNMPRVSYGPCVRNPSAKRVLLIPNIAKK